MVIMGTESIICLAVYFSVSLLMIGIGISQLKSKTPVTFYSREKPFSEKEPSDVHQWNKNHGIIWIIYGIIILISYAIGAIIGTNSICCTIPLAGGIIIPLISMILYHHRLIKLYEL